MLNKVADRTGLITGDSKMTMKECFDRALEILEDPNSSRETMNLAMTFMNSVALQYLPRSENLTMDGGQVFMGLFAASQKLYRAMLDSHEADLQ